MAATNIHVDMIKFVYELHTTYNTNSTSLLAMSKNSVSLYILKFYLNFLPYLFNIYKSSV